MMRKFLLVLISAMFMGLASSAQTFDRAHTLKVYTWNDYTDMDLIPEFEKFYEEVTGEPVHIVYQTFDINEYMLTEIEEGHEDYDVVCPSEYIVERMIKKGLLTKIDTNFVEGVKNNLGNTAPFIKNLIRQMSDSVDVLDYVSPYVWGTTGFLFNKAYVSKEEVMSWGALHNPKFKGQIYVKDAFRDVYSVLIQFAKRDEIAAGTADRQQLACDLNAENLRAVEDVLIEARPQVAGWEAAFGKERMCQGKVWLNLTWSGDAQWAIDEEDEGVELDYVVPEEGTNAWIDTYVIPKYAVNRKAAAYFINFLNIGEHAVRNMAASGYVSCVGVPEVLEAMQDSAYDYVDASYFFGPEASHVRLNHVLYPDKSVIGHTILMHDAGAEAEALIEMWSRAKGNNLNWKMITFEAVVFGALIFFLIWRRWQMHRRRQMRRERLKKLSVN